MSERRLPMIRFLQRLHAIAPLGYSVGVHIRFAAPLYAKSTMPEPWQDTYAKNGYSLRDPTIFWGISKSGATRWSEITLPDPFGVMQKAREHGLNHGVTASCGKITSRTLVGVAADEREFSDAEIAEILDIAQTLHEVSAPLAELTPAMLESLSLVRSGTSHGEAAARIGVSEEAYLSRLAAARQRLGVETVEDAVTAAREFELI